MKLAIVTAIPTPYRDPFWNHVAAQPGVDIEVFYCSQGKPDRPWQVTWEQKYQSHNLPSVNLLKWAGTDASAYWVRGLQHALKRGEYDGVVVGGYNHPSMLMTIRSCVRRSQPFFLMCETYRKSSGWKAPIRNHVVGYVCRNAAGGMPTGTLASGYLASYGIDEDRQIRVPNVPDVNRLQHLGDEYRRSRDSIRRELGLPDGDEKVLTFVGRLIAKKRAGAGDPCVRRQRAGGRETCSGGRWSLDEFMPRPVYRVVGSGSRSPAWLLPACRGSPLCGCF